MCCSRKEQEDRCDICDGEFEEGFTYWAQAFWCFIEEASDDGDGGFGVEDEKESDALDEVSQSCDSVKGL